MSSNIAVINNIWRDTARGAKLFFLPAYAAAPAMLFSLHIRLWTFVVLLVTLALVLVLARRGIGVGVAALSVRAFLAGKTVHRRRRLAGRYLNK